MTNSMSASKKFALVITSGVLPGHLECKVYEVSRNCTKMLFIRGGLGWERRFDKRRVRYRLFYTKEEATAAMPTVITLCEREVHRSRAAYNAAMDALNDAVSTLAKEDGWLGGEMRSKALWT